MIQAFLSSVSMRGCPGPATFSLVVERMGWLPGPPRASPHSQEHGLELSACQQTEEQERYGTCSADGLAEDERGPGGAADPN